MVSKINAYILDVLGFQYNAAVWIGRFLCHTHNHIFMPKVNYKITENNPPKWFTPEAMQASSESWPHFEVTSPQFPTGWPSSHAYLKSKLHAEEDSKL